MTSEMAILGKIKEILIREYDTYKEDEDDTSLTSDNVMIDLVDIDKMRDDVGVWLDARSINVDDYTTNEDEMNMNVTIALVCKRAESTALRTRIFNMKSAIYRILRNNQDLDDTVDLVTIESYNYYPQLFLEIGIVGMDLHITVNYVESW